MCVCIFALVYVYVINVYACICICIHAVAMVRYGTILEDLAREHQVCMYVCM